MKLTAAIVGAYMPKEVMYNGELRAVYGISAYEVILYNKRDGCEHDYVAYEHCQLILLPFDKISDEDAAEVAKIMGYDMKKPPIVKSSRTTTEQGRYMVVRVAEGRGVLWHSVSDYLRSKGYDCGHGSIPSLIAAGVAVKKEQSKDADNQPDYKAQVRAVFPDSYIGKFEPDEFGVILHPDQDEDFMCVDTSKTESGAWQLAYEKLKKKGVL